MESKYLKYKDKYITLRKQSNIFNIINENTNYKDKYITLRKQIGGAQKTIVSDGITYQGAGVLIINQHTNSRGKRADHVIFFKQTKDNMLDLPGGRCEDFHTSLEETASIELYEESRKSIGITKKNISTYTFVTVDGRAAGLPGQFKCYIVRARDISSQVYKHNKIIFDALIDISNPRFGGSRFKRDAEERRLKSFLETSELCRVPVSTMEQLVGTTNNSCTDDEGNTVKVSYQSLRVYREALAKGILPRSINDILPSNGVLKNAGQSDRTQNDSLKYTDPFRRLIGTTINYN